MAGRAHSACTSRAPGLGPVELASSSHSLLSQSVLEKGWCLGRESGSRNSEGEAGDEINMALETETLLLESIFFLLREGTALPD